MAENIGQMMTGGDRGNRQRNDFYPTPPEVTRALLESYDFDSHIWEPCAGDGAMTDVLKGYGFITYSSDIDPQREDIEKFDFLKMKYKLADAIITNPPFSIAEDIIRKCLELDVSQFALLLKSTYWHAKRRTDLFYENTPAAILPLNWRPDFLNKGAPTMDVMWCVWDKNWKEKTTYAILEKPE